MKKLFLPVLALMICISLTSCFDMEEQYVLNADGSYSLEYSMNMGKAFSLLSGMMPDSVKQASSYTTRKDSLISLTGDMPDSVRRKLSAREYAMLEKSRMRLNMQLSEGLMEISFLNSGSSLDELDFFINNFGPALKKTGKEKEAIQDIAGSVNTPQQDRETDGFFGEKDFTIAITSNSFSRTIIPERWEKKQEEDKETNAMMESLGLGMSHTTTITFPRPVKKVDHPGAELSADRKTLTCKVNLLEAMKKPESMNLKVEY